MYEPSQILAALTGGKCQLIAAHTALKEKWQAATLGAGLFFLFMIGPGIAFFWLGFDPCINTGSGLFGGVCGIYIFVCILFTARLWLEYQNARFCSAEDARWTLKPVVCTFMALNGMMTIYLIYTWTHNLIALAGSGLCAIFFIVFYFVSTLHHHNRICLSGSHSNPASMYNSSTSALQAIDFLIVLSVLAYYIVIYWLDDQLSFASRSTVQCLTI